MSFFTGFATGLASSLDKGLQTAMDKRSKQISKAEDFIMQRQADKQDLADKRDKMAFDHLDTLITETKGDITKAVAIYEAAGGNPEDVGVFLNDINETRRAGLDFKIEDRVDFSKVDLANLGNIDLQTGRDFIRTELTGAPVLNLEDTSGLSTIGLGMKNMGKGIAENVNSLITPRERKSIEGITGAVIDRTGMLPATKFERDMLNSMPDLTKALSNNVLILTTGKDHMGRTVNINDPKRLIEQAKLVTGIKTLNRAKDTSTSGLSAATISGAFSKRVSELTNNSGYNVNSNGVVTLQPKGGEILEGDAAVTQWSQMLSDLKSDFVKSTILDDDGSFKSNDAQEISYALGLGDVVESVQKQMADAPKVSQPQNTPATVKADPNTYVSNVMAANPNTPPATIQAALVAAGVPQAKISQILASMDDDS